LQEIFKMLAETRQTITNYEKGAAHLMNQRRHPRFGAAVLTQRTYVSRAARNVITSTFEDAFHLGNTGISLEDFA